MRISILAAISAIGVGILAVGSSAQVVLRDADGDGHPMFGATAQRPDFEFFGDHEPRGGEATFVTFGDLDGDGDPDALCTLNDGGRAQDLVSYITIMRNAGDGVFGPPTSYIAGGESCAADLGDVDGDGDLDVAVANAKDDTVAILRNFGDATLDIAVSYVVGDEPRSVKFADIDADGDLDVVVLNCLSNDVSVLINAGDGIYLPERRIAVGGVTQRGDPNLNFPESGPHMAIGDFNGDGRIDAAIPAERLIKLMFNDGVGGLALAAVHPRATTTEVYAIHANDLDGDGDIDLACAVAESLGADESLQVFMNDGGGVFGPPAAYSSDPWDCPGCFFFAQAIAGADFDHDDDVDLVVGQYNFPFYSIFRNAGDGTFAAREVHEVNTKSMLVAAHDVSGDGWADAVIGQGHSGNGSIQAHLNSGDGAVLSIASIPDAFESPLRAGQTVAASDFDSDGDTDFVVGMRGGDYPVRLRLFHNDSDRDMRPGESFSFGPPGSSSIEHVNVGMLNKDDIPDIIACDTVEPGGFLETGRIWLLIGRGEMTFDAPLAIELPDVIPMACEVDDVDGDADMDLVVWAIPPYPGVDGVATDRRVVVLLNDGNGEFHRTPDVIFAEQVWNPKGGIKLVDLDQDHDLDIIVSWGARRSPGGVRAILNEGNGLWTLGASVQVALHSFDLQAAVDVTGIRVYVLHYHDEAEHEYLTMLRYHDAEFHTIAKLRDHVAGRGPTLVMCDMDYDGRSDLIMPIEPGGADVVLFRDIPFAVASSRTAGLDYTTDVACQDFDNDGRLDVLSIHYNKPSILWNAGRFPCPPDLSRDGRLNVFDFLAFQRAFGDGQSVADFADPRGVYDVADYIAFREAFNAGCS